MRTSNRTILLVEDDPNDVSLIAQAFEEAGSPSDLHSVTDGDLAIAYLGGKGDYADRVRHPLPNLILLDIKLPRRSGLEVLEWIRRQPELQALPVVILTSSRQAVNMKRATELGANSYLVKPVSFARLLEMVRAVDSYWFDVHVDVAEAHV